MTPLVDVPAALYLECPECRVETLHEVLKGRATMRGKEMRLTALVKCPDCGHIRTVNVREGAETEVPAVISNAGVSVKTKIPLDPASEISLDDVLIIDGLPCLVTGVETRKGRPSHAKVPSILTLWLKRYDKVLVKLSVNSGKRTVPRELWAMPDEEFSVGDVVTAQGMKVLVHSIKLAQCKLRRGSAKARLIRRLYGREVE